MYKESMPNKRAFRETNDIHLAFEDSHNSSPQGKTIILSQQKGWCVCMYFLKWLALEVIFWCYHTILVFSTYA